MPEKIIQELDNTLEKINQCYVKQCPRCGFKTDKKDKKICPVCETNLKNIRKNKSAKSERNNRQRNPCRCNSCRR